MKNNLFEMRDEIYTQGLIDLINYIKKHVKTEEMSMIEIGSYAGESTKIFSENFKSVISIDPFISNYDPNDVTCNFTPLEEVYNVFTEVLNKHSNIKHIRMTSDDAINELIGEKFDFVYIDGLHTYEQIKKDINNYIPLLKNNCFIGGHDYDLNWYGVVKGINEVLGEPDLIFRDNSWIKKIL
jgi:predicted O-methyltransferase YrrM